MTNPETRIRQAVAAEVRAALGRDGRKPATLAADTGIDRSTLSRKLRGLASFTADELVEIAAALDIPAGDLLAPAVASRLAA